MAETASVNDIYQVRLQGRIEGQETNNVLHFLCTGADSDVELHLIQVLLSCFITNVLPVLASAWTLERIVWKRVGPTLGPEIISLPEGDASGGVTTDALPSFCSAVMSIRTALGGRSHRGRFYLAGIPEASVTGSSIPTESALWAALLAFATCLVTNFVPGDPPGAPSYAMGVYSRVLGGAAFPYTTPGFSAMKEVHPVQQIGTTRSRKVGRGS